jgi:CheY-like chemotaxis protein
MPARAMSRLGEGTTFSIYVPLEASPLPARLRPPSEASVRGGERILIVDDESDIVDTLSIGLERLGYETVGVTDAMEALEAFQENPKAWDIVVTDEVMPGLLGLDLIRRLKAIRPDVKAVLCTGYSDATVEEVTRGAGVDVFLLKPVDAASIAIKLRELMAAAPAK